MATPRKLPASTHRRRGSYREDRHGGVTPPVEAPKRPADLSKAAEPVWNELATLLQENQLVTKMDGLALRLLSESIELYRKATDLITQEGAILDTETMSGEARRIINPAIKVRDSAWTQIQKMCSEFGLTPKARNSLDSTPTAVPETDIMGILGLSVR
jgi:P27 family predicted phage terminase small subunit